MPSARTLMFAGFRSRWMMPCSCAASSASAIWRAIGSASSSGSGPRAMRCGEVFAFDQLHHERGDAVLLFEPVDLRDVRMIERGERLALRARSARGAPDRRANSVGQDLERDVAIELRIARAIDLPHAAGAKATEEFKAAEARTFSERHPNSVADYTDE